MSHFTSIKTQMVEKEYVLRALQDLGYKYEVGTFKLWGVGAGSTSVEIKVRTGFLSGAVGFRKSGKTYDVIADWFGVRIGRAEFVRQVTQRYAYHAARAKLEEQGFAPVTEEKQKDGQIHLVLRRVGP
jgi:hypothetical protein